MRILAVTDIHGRKNIGSEVKKQLSSADIVVIAGDITNFGHAPEARSIIENIKLYNENILAVPGNCDNTDINDTLIHAGYNLHGISKTIGNTAFYGLGGSSRTPFNTPQENEEHVINSILEKFKKYSDQQFHVFVSHSPPAHTKLDRTFLGLHAGSTSVRKFIEKFQPDVVICGHIHEAHGTDELGSSIMINPGPFPKHYAIIDLSKKIAFQLY